MTLTNQNMWTALLFLIGSGLQISGFQAQWAANTCFVISAGLLLYSVIETANVPGGLTSKWHAWLALRLGGKLSLRACTGIGRGAGGYCAGPPRKLQGNKETSSWMIIVKKKGNVQINKKKKQS